MAEHMVPRDGDQPLRFQGEEIGHAESRWDHDRPRWMEITIYRAHMAVGQYVVSGIGRTVVPGEEDRPWVAVCATPEEVIESLVRPPDEDGIRYLTRVARNALRGACELDPGLRDAYRAWRTAGVAEAG